VSPDWTTPDRADQMRSAYRSFWDALLVAACLDAGVATLYSEDFDPGSRIDSLQIVNPFK